MNVGEFRVRVARRDVVADDVVALTLVAVDGAPLPEWSPGAHIDIVLSDEVIRQYSLCGEVADPAYRIAVLRCADGRGGSRAVHELRPGSPLTVRGPRNHFELEPADEYLFIAGGIGITPLLPMMRAADAAGTPWRLVYGGRTLPTMAFVAEIDGLKGVVDLRPQDRYGLLDLHAIVDAAPDAAVYACGPSPLLDALESLCRQLGRERPHVERFAAGALEPHDDQPFEVELARTGGVVHVGADTSILEALEAFGLSPGFSCREGTCGTCEVPVIGGEVDHRDVLLTPEERAANDTMMICVSRSSGERLVLDL